MKCNKTLLLISGGISYCGSAMTALVAAALFAERVADPARFAWLFLSLALPPILFQKITERMLAHFGPRSVMLVAEVLRFGLVAALAVIASLGSASVPVLLVFQFLLATLATFFISAFFSLLPTLVARDEIESFSSYSGTTTQLGYLIGLGVFSTCYGMLAPAWFLGFDALSFLASAALLAIVSINPVSKPRLDNDTAVVDAQPPLAMLKGLDLRALAFVAAVPLALVELFNSSQSVLALKLSDFGAQGLGWIDFASCLGIIVGGLALPRLHVSFRRSGLDYRCALLSMLAVFAGLMLSRTHLSLNIGLAVGYGLLYSYLATTSRAALYLAHGDDPARIRRGVVLIGVYESLLVITTAVCVPLVMAYPLAALGLLCALALLYVRVVFLRPLSMVQHMEDLK